MKQHIHVSIDTLLLKSNRSLQELFPTSGLTGKEIRVILREKKRNGELLLGCQDCEGFSPITGCPGHPDIDKEAIA